MGGANTHSIDVESACQQATDAAVAITNSNSETGIDCQPTQLLIRPIGRVLSLTEVVEQVKEIRQSVDGIRRSLYKLIGEVFATFYPFMDETITAEFGMGYFGTRRRDDWSAILKLCLEEQIPDKTNRSRWGRVLMHVLSEARLERTSEIMMPQAQNGSIMSIAEAFAERIEREGGYQKFANRLVQQHSPTRLREAPAPAQSVIRRTVLEGAGAAYSQVTKPEDLPLAPTSDDNLARMITELVERLISGGQEDERGTAATKLIAALDQRFLPAESADSNALTKALAAALKTIATRIFR
jgi:hypothetical protein